MLSPHYNEALLRIKDVKILKIEKRCHEPIVDIWIGLKQDIQGKRTSLWRSVYPLSLSQKMLCLYPVWEVI